MQRLEQLNTIIDNLIQETDNINIKKALEDLRPKRRLFPRIKKQSLTQEEFIHIIKKIAHIIYPEINKKYPFSLNQNEDLNYQLTSVLKTFYNIHYKVSFKQSKAKIYPISLDEKTAREIYKNELLNIIQEHIYSCEDYSELFKKRIAIYKDRINFYKKNLNELELEPYYGTPKFMYERARYIIECANKLPFKTESYAKQLQEMESFIKMYPETSSIISPSSYPYYDKTYKNNYEKFEQNYLNIINYENTLLPNIVSIWQSYLCNPNHHNNKSFRYIIHTFSEALVSPERMTKACCCLATENLLTTPYGNCGLIYDFTPDNVEAISYEDAKSWQLNKKKFIERDLPITWQLTSSGIFYEDPQISKLILPKELEKYGISNNLIHNHELLNYNIFCAYTEILLNSKAKVIGVFYTDSCSNIKEISDYAKKYNLPLIYLSLSELRKRAGLNPVPPQLESNKEADNTLKH